MEKQIKTNQCTDDGWLKIHEYGSGNVFPGSGLAEESVEGVVPSADCLVAGHLTVWLDTVLETVHLPARITDLASGLTDVNNDTVSLRRSITIN